METFSQMRCLIRNKNNMKKSIKLIIFAFIVLGIAVLSSDFKSYSGSEVLEVLRADSIKSDGTTDVNQGNGSDSQPPVQVNTSDLPKEITPNPEVKEVPVGQTPEGRDSIEAMKNKDLPVIANDSTIVKVKPTEEKK